jgi:hypothetical protein
MESVKAGLVQFMLTISLARGVLPPSQGFIYLFMRSWKPEGFGTLQMSTDGPWGVALGF